MDVLETGRGPHDERIVRAIRAMAACPQCGGTRAVYAAGPNSYGIECVAEGCHTPLYPRLPALTAAQRFVFVFPDDGFAAEVDIRALSANQLGELEYLHPEIYTRKPFTIVLSRAFLTDEQYAQLEQQRRA